MAQSKHEAQISTNEVALTRFYRDQYYERIIVTKWH